MKLLAKIGDRRLISDFKIGVILMPQYNQHIHLSFCNP